MLGYQTLLVILERYYRTLLLFIVMEHLLILGFMLVKMVVGMVLVKLNMFILMHLVPVLFTVKALPYSHLQLRFVI